MIDALLLVCSVLVLVPVLVLCAELFAARWARAPSEAGAPGPACDAGRIAVLMPAHDEAGGIEPAIAALREQLRPGDRLLVVADNCSDDTAAVARAAGAEVIERRDERLRGKGYALDFGVRWLEADPPQLLAIVDADCIVARGALDRLARQCSHAGRPVQALYLMDTPPNASARARIAAFAWRVKNLVRPLGAAALGAPCQLMGTGMMFPWGVIRGASLASGHLVEDMQLGLDLAAAGMPPQFCPQALVRSAFPSDEQATASQRTRWEHGHLSVIAAVAPRLLYRALRHRDTMLGLMVLDLMVPPLASLVLVLAALCVITAGWWAWGGSAMPLALMVFAFGLLTFGVVVTWRRFGREVVTLRDLLTLPGYVLAKLPVYLRLFTRRQSEWVRTKRDERGR